MNYVTIAKKLYGETCELCGWRKATCDVHHIRYQEHQELENSLRRAFKAKNMAEFDKAQQIALSKGYGLFNIDTLQLPKNDNPENLAVLCPNCHREVHEYDLGDKLLELLTERKKVNSEALEFLRR